MKIDGIILDRRDLNSTSEVRLFKRSFGREIIFVFLCKGGQSSFRLSLPKDDLLDDYALVLDKPVRMRFRA